EYEREFPRVDVVFRAPADASEAVARVLGEHDVEPDPDGDGSTVLSVPASSGTTRRSRRRRDWPITPSSSSPTGSGPGFAAPPGRSSGATARRMTRSRRGSPTGSRSRPGIERRELPHTPRSGPSRERRDEPVEDRRAVLARD